MVSYKFAGCLVEVVLFNYGYGREDAWNYYEYDAKAYPSADSLLPCLIFEGYAWEVEISYHNECGQSNEDHIYEIEVDCSYEE